MSPIDKLRNIGRLSPDRNFQFQIETWIAQHTLEFGNSFCISELEPDQARAIRHYSEESLFRITSSIIDKASDLREVPLYNSVKPTDMKNDMLEFSIKYERKICVIVGDRK